VSATFEDGKLVVKPKTAGTIASLRYFPSAESEPADLFNECEAIGKPEPALSVGVTPDEATGRVSGIIEVRYNETAGEKRRVGYWINIPTTEKGTGASLARPMPVADQSESGGGTK
jgi:hypothetical protein